MDFVGILILVGLGIIGFFAVIFERHDTARRIRREERLRYFERKRLEREEELDERNEQ